MKNNQLILKDRPKGIPHKECFQKVTIDTPDINNGEILVEVLYLSIDPAMRGWMNEGKSYIKPVEIGEVMRSLGIGKVIESKSEKFELGDIVTASVGVQEYSVLRVKEATKIDPIIAELPVYLGTLGMSGLTGYFGLLNTGLPKEGETLLVSGAAGAVGSVVGQIGKIKGCNVVGIAGTEQKCEYVKSKLGFDDCLNYNSDTFIKDLRKSCPEGVDIYFDNVGGEILDIALAMINLRARIVICGAISQYNSVNVKGPKNYLSLLVNRAKMEGIVVFDNIEKYPEALRQMAIWIKEGRLNANYQEANGGIDAFYQTFLNLFEGGNTGKLVLKMKN